MAAFFCGECAHRCILVMDGDPFTIPWVCPICRDPDWNEGDFSSVIVPCPCTSGHLFPASSACKLCNGTGKISYGLTDVEVADGV